MRMYVLCVCAHISNFLYLYLHILICVHMYIHTFIHTFLHTCIFLRLDCSCCLHGDSLQRKRKQGIKHLMQRYLLWKTISSAVRPSRMEVVSATARGHDLKLQRFNAAFQVLGPAL